MIGSLGDLIFTCSSEEVKTLEDLNFKRAAKFAEHEIHGQKNLLEFTGLSACEASLKINLSAYLGADVKAELKKLRDMLENHEAVSFVLDGEPQGAGLWVLVSLDEAHELLDNHGRSISASVGISLKEYI